MRLEKGIGLKQLHAWRSVSGEGNRTWAGGRGTARRWMPAAGTAWLMSTRLQKARPSDSAATFLLSGPRFQRAIAGHANHLENTDKGIDSFRHRNKAVLGVMMHHTDHSGKEKLP